MIRRVLAWLACLACAAAGTGLVALAGMPSPALFGSLLGGMAFALFAPSGALRPRMPHAAATLAQGIVGVAIGAYVDAATLAQLAAHGAPILLVCLATVATSLALGSLLTHWGASLATGVFAMISGGATGITAIARELGADDRAVAVIQYLRVVIVLAGMPVITAVAFHPTHGGTQPAAAGGAAATSGSTTAAYILVTLVGGLLLARVLRLPAGAILGPLAVALAVSLSGWFPPVVVPVWPQLIAYVVIGLQVGLRFTRSSLRHIAGLLPAAVGLILTLLVLSALFGLLLVAWVGVTPRDAYLATTPGGLYAVLAVAVDSGADVSFILTVQVVRLIAVLTTAPLVARAMRRRRTPAATCREL